MRFFLEQSDELLYEYGGLAFIGSLLSTSTLKKRLNAVSVPECKKPEISHYDVIASYIGLLSLRLHHFDSIEQFRHDEGFKLLLGLDIVPSSPTLRQRLDQLSNNDEINEIIKDEMEKLFIANRANFVPCLDGMVPLDVDVSPMDNSRTKKENVSLTYKKFVGFSPIFAYFGQIGYCIGEELRPGKMHCQNGTPQFLEEIILRAKRLTDNDILVRLDSGNDAKDNYKLFFREDTKVDFIVKRNLRRQSKEIWLEEAEKKHEVQFVKENNGKQIYRGSVEQCINGNIVRIVFEVTKILKNKDDKWVLFPEVEIDTYATSLSRAYSDTMVIELYHDHGTSEQYHSETKDDLDLERLPSGKFKTNTLILSLATFASNMLRLLGQKSLEKGIGSSYTEKVTITPKKGFSIAKNAQTTSETERNILAENHFSPKNYQESLEPHFSPDDNTTQEKNPVYINGQDTGSEEANSLNALQTLDSASKADQTVAPVNETILSEETPNRSLAGDNSTQHDKTFLNEPSPQPIIFGVNSIYKGKNIDPSGKGKVADNIPIEGYIIKGRRCRIKTIIDQLIKIKVKIVYHARRYTLKFSRDCRIFEHFKFIYANIV